MKILITLLKPLSFLPALLMMYIIFSFSAQPGEVSGNLSYKISYEIIETKSELLSENLSSIQKAFNGEIPFNRSHMHIGIAEMLKQFVHLRIKFIGNMLCSMSHK